MENNIYKKDIKDIFEFFTNKKLIDGIDLAKLTQILIDFEENVGGPYKNKNGIVEKETNLAIYNFLKTQDIFLPKLAKYLDIKNSKNKIVNNKKRKDLFTRKVEKQVEFLFKKNSTESKKMIDKVWNKLKKSETYKIIIWNPIWVNNQLKNKINDDVFLTKLSVLNVLGWIAYTIYDDVIDDDKNNEWIPVANMVSRLMNSLFVQLLNKIEFLDEFEKIMIDLEEANLWELKNCRNIKKIPNFDKVEKYSNKSLGHAITAIAILYKNNENKNNIRNLINFYKYYLAGRQMNDDAHDWFDDLKNGRINSASALLIKKYPKIVDENKLKMLFWKDFFDDYAKKIIDYCGMANKYIKKTNCFKSLDIFDKMLEKVTKITKSAIEEKNKSKDFINEYFKK